MVGKERRVLQRKNGKAMCLMDFPHEPLLMPFASTWMAVRVSAGQRSAVEDGRKGGLPKSNFHFLPLMCSQGLEN